MTYSILVLLAVAASTSWATSVSNSGLARRENNATALAPVVDLDYALYAPQITTSPDERTYYNFSNIRYAAPPVDALRFRLPRTPSTTARPASRMAPMARSARSRTLRGRTPSS